MNRAKNTKIILWFVTGFAAAVAVNRFIFGLGATTNLNDEVPWGFWIGFDVVSGVALAAGGFVATAIFYVMKRDEFHELVKPAILTAFLGYLAVIFSLLIDLGLPWNIWHMIIYWNPHSPLFEVGWCVMLYTTVLILEFSPVPLENYSRYAKIRNFLMKFRFPLVLLGIMLSTLHQSSLGTLFLIMPSRLYPLWYTHLLPVLFFTSAVALGLAVIIFENLISHWLYKREVKTNILNSLSHVLIWVLLVYFAIRMVDIAAAGKFALIFNGSWLSNLFIIEMLLIVLIPVALFSSSRLRNNIAVQWAGSTVVIAGIVLNRFNVSGFAMIDATKWYTPSWMEIVLSLGIISSAALVFMFAIEKFNVWEEKPEDFESLPHTPPLFDLPSHSWIGTPDIASFTRHTLAFIFSFAIGMAVIPESRLYAKGVYHIKVKPASVVDNLADTLCINGNVDKQYVTFSHRAHILWIKEHGSALIDDSLTAIFKSTEKIDSCVVCHHLSLPGEKISSCWECHSDMYTMVDFFKHDWHASADGGNIRCSSCHQMGATRDGKSAKDCTACHPSYKFPAASLKSQDMYTIPSYVDAMHKMCVSCHLIESRKIKEKPSLAQCTTCHKVGTPPYLSSSLKWNIRLPRFNNVILPSLEVSKK